MADVAVLDQIIQPEMTRKSAETFSRAGCTEDKW